MSSTRASNESPCGIALSRDVRVVRPPELSACPSLPPSLRVRALRPYSPLGRLHSLARSVYRSCFAACPACPSPEITSLCFSGQRRRRRRLLHNERTSWDTRAGQPKQFLMEPRIVIRLPPELFYFTLLAFRIGPVSLVIGQSRNSRMAAAHVEEF